MRPFGLDPSYLLNGANDRTYSYRQNRVSSSFTVAKSAWTSESRFGWNFNDMQRLDQYFTLKDPSGVPENLPWGRSIPRISVSGSSGFSVGSAEIWDMNGTTYTFDQKVAHVMGKHSLKFGGRYMYNGGFRSNPENPAFSFQSKADFLANIPSSVVPSFGSPPFVARMNEFGVFVQDDWRVTTRLVLNLGLRYDFYGKLHVDPTTSNPVGFYNLSPPTNWNTFNFGPYRDPNDPYNNDAWVNLGPRFGFAYTLDSASKTVVRGGFGVLFSPQMPGVVRQGVADPVVPFRVTWSLAEAQALGLSFPKYNDQMRVVVEQQIARSNTLFPFSAINPGLQDPYSMHYQFNVQHALTSSLMIETGYVGVGGVKFILHRRPNLPDRLTGERPNPNIVFGGYYVDNSQNTSYNAWQTSVRKRFSHNFTFDGHYTFSKSLGLTGGDIGAYYGSDNDQVNIQDFNNLRADRGPNPGDTPHRFVGDWVYEVPTFKGMHPLLRHTVGGWQVSGILSARTGERLIISESCASSYFCRPDYAGGATVTNDWENAGTPRCIVGARCNVQYLNRSAFALVPVDPNTRIAIRPGTLANGAVRGPSSVSVDFSLAKNFKIGEQWNLQFRSDMFNATNHVNYNGPATGANSATFGEISGAGSMRVIQLNAKLTW